MAKLQERLVVLPLNEDTSGSISALHGLELHQKGLRPERYAKACRSRESPARHPLNTAQHGLNWFFGKAPRREQLLVQRFGLNHVTHHD